MARETDCASLITLSRNPNLDVIAPSESSQSRSRSRGVSRGNNPAGKQERFRQIVPLCPSAMPPGTPYHSFALPYPIRVDNFTAILDDLPPPYNRPPLHLLTHTHSDHIHGLASKSFAYRVICSPDTKEMLLRHEVYAERSLYNHQYRAEKKKTFGHLKIDPLLMPNGQKFFTGSRDLLVCNLFFSIFFSRRT